MTKSKTISTARKHLAWISGSPEGFEFFGCKDDDALLDEIETIARGEGIIKPADIHTGHPAQSLDFADLLETLTVMYYA